MKFDTCPCCEKDNLRILNTDIICMTPGCDAEDVPISKDIWNGVMQKVIIKSRHSPFDGKIKE